LTVVAKLAAALEIPAKRSEADRVCCWRIPEVAPVVKLLGVFRVSYARLSMSTSTQLEAAVASPLAALQIVPLFGGDIKTEPADGTIRRPTRGAGKVV
jgi:hypothetical protein